MRRPSVWVWVMTVLALLVAVASYRYLLPGMPAGAPNVVANRLVPTGALAVHAALGASVLILGAFQFMPGVRRRWPAWHRRAGTGYVAGVMFAGAAGLALAFGATAGPVASLGFGLLAVCWLITTANAWRLARARDYLAHERWMTRSYALTFAAVTLRLYLPLFALAHVDFMAGYRIDSFLAWVPNLIVAEWLIARRRQPGATPLAASEAAS